MNRWTSKIVITEVIESDFKMRKVEIDHENGIHCVRNVEFDYEKPIYQRIRSMKEPNGNTNEISLVSKFIKKNTKSEDENIFSKLPKESVNKLWRIDIRKPSIESAHSKNLSSDYTNTSTPKTVDTKYIMSSSLLKSYRRKYNNLRSQKSEHSLMTDLESPTLVQTEASKDASKTAESNSEYLGYRRRFRNTSTQHPKY